MARRKKKDGGGGGAAWLVTFSDLMTLLLTFFVLLLSMASMNTTTITRISAHSKGLSMVENSGLGQIPQRVELVAAALKDPTNVLSKKKRIKDLLFPNDVLPPDVTQKDLAENIDILEHPEGVVISLTDNLLFAKQSATLAPRGKKLLDQLTLVIYRVNADINLSGHTSKDEDDGTVTGPYELSFQRAALVLEHFLQMQLTPDRFSLSGYGSDKPVNPDSAASNDKDRRVEILIKTTPRVGHYM